MRDQFTVTLAQLNAVLGDLQGNAEQAYEAWCAAKEAQSDFVLLPEMFLTGYNAQDLFMNVNFLRDCRSALDALAARCADGPVLGIGVPYEGEGGLFNGYAILQDGHVSTVVKKHILPNNRVFDEKRIFDAGHISGPVNIRGVRVGIPICEDAWHADVAEALAESGAQMLLVPNGSPYYRGKFDVRQMHMVARVVETGLPLAYVNLVGAQDDQIFDGSSFVLGRNALLMERLADFTPEIRHVTFERDADGWNVPKGQIASVPDTLEQDYHAMVVALSDYLGKSGFSKVLLGLSGGVDSAIVAVIAADAIGAQNVRCVMLPSEYTSAESLADAQGLIDTLGAPYQVVPIKQGRDAISATLAPIFEGRDPDLTEENIQSRLRGLLLMAMSNKFGEMLLTTGNKSEVAVGYATIYGDMAGGYNPIKDLYKTRVFEICRWRNRHHRAWMMGPSGAVIPQNIIDKPPSAELRPDQKDSDSLPDYDVLDGILTGLVDEEASVDELVAQGYGRADVMRVQHLLYISEYKRFQSAPGARLSARAFWLDRRYPIVNKWRDT
jgi:NAD+ synthase